MEQERARFDADGYRGDRAALHEGDRGRAHPPGAQQPRHQPALGRLRARLDLQLREPGRQRPASARSACARSRPRRASATCRRWSPPPPARSSWRRSATASEDKVVDKLIQQAVLNVFNRYFSVADFEELVAAFENGLQARSLRRRCPRWTTCCRRRRVKTDEGSRRQARCAGQPGARRLGVEFVLEGLHLNRKLNKDRTAAGARYRRGQIAHCRGQVESQAQVESRRSPSSAVASASVVDSPYLTRRPRLWTFRPATRWNGDAMVIRYSTAAGTARSSSFRSTPTS